jgi:two-component system, OmpR family, phosphate regulon sensor histidine kinase PhoR
VTNRRLIWQLYPSQLIITLAALLAVTLYATSSIRVFQVQQIESALEARAHLVRGQVLDLLNAGDIDGLRAFCREAGTNSGTRLTVVASDGLVVADSYEVPEQMENHRGRPEIIAALEGQTLGTTRFSQTAREHFMYMAIPLGPEGAPVAVLRTSLPLTAIDRTLAEIHRQIAWSGLVVALAVILVAWITARRISRPLEEMKLGAERFAAGNFSGRIKEDGAAELAGLAKAMNEMASQLDYRLQTILRQHNELQAVFSSMVEGVITVDSGERVLGVNQAGARLLGVDPERIKGRSLQLAIRNTQLQGLLRKALSCSAPIEGEFTLVDDSGREKFFHARGARLVGTHSEGTGALLVIDDVTGMRRLERIRSDFVANVSHELKTPITSIEGFAETLQEGALDEPEEARRFVAIIHQQARRLHAIVEDLLALAHIEQDAKRQLVTLQELSIKESLQSALEACSHQAAARNTKIHLRCAETIMARIDPALLEQAVINLVDNAVKYSPEGAEVHIEAAREENEVLIRVRDNGMGIPSQAIPRIFERFYRVDKARSAKLDSTGLGLAIVKHIVQAHNGRVTVESTLDRGSTFTIHLPGAVLRG